MFTLSAREYEMGEDTFVESYHETLGAALKAASNFIAENIVGDSTTDEWSIIDPEGSDPSLKLEVQWSCTETDSLDRESEYTSDYILQVVESE